MKKLLSIIGVLGIGLLGSNAASYSIDSVNANIFVPANGSIAGTWNLIALGYNSANEQVTSAEAYFTLFDFQNGPFDGGNETAVVSLDGLVFGSASNFYLAGIGGNLSITLVEDGIVNWVVAETSGLSGFALTDATFNVETATRTQRVPDGGSIMTLLGLSVLGLGWVGRRIRD